MMKMRFLLLCIVIAVAQSEVIVKDIIPPGPPFVPPNNTNSSTPLPPTTTIKPTISTTKPTISTTKPTTPVPPPPTTTTTTTTSPPPPTTTTTTTPPPPTTTTTPPPPTTTPPPVPEPSVGKWTVNYTNSNATCIVFDLAAQFEIPVRNSTVKLNLPDTAVASGTCDKTVQNIQLNWTVAENVSNVLEFGFSLNNNKFELEAVVAVLNLTIPSSGPQVFNLSHVNPEFSTPVKNSYKCDKVQTLEMKESGSNQTVQLKIKHVQFEPFTNVTGHTFSTAKDCEGSVTSDVVPIVVGCVLAALVVMVLIAYLIGRRRCQARGYLSMFDETKREEDYIPMKNLSCFK